MRIKALAGYRAEFARGSSPDLQIRLVEIASGLADFKNMYI
jgi:hypothetical protein